MVAFSTDAPGRPQVPPTPTLRSLFLPVSNHASAVGFPCASQIVPRLISRPVPANCSTPFWDPIEAKCLCASDSCAFTDDPRPIGVSVLNAVTESGLSFSPT